MDICLYYNSNALYVSKELYEDFKSLYTEPKGACGEKKELYIISKEL